MRNAQPRPGPAQLNDYGNGGWDGQIDEATTAETSAGRLPCSFSTPGYPLGWTIEMGGTHGDP